MSEIDWAAAGFLFACGAIGAIGLVLGLLVVAFEIGRVARVAWDARKRKAV